MKKPIISYGYPDYLHRPFSTQFMESMKTIIPDGKIKLRTLTIPENSMPDDFLDYNRIMNDITLQQTNQCHSKREAQLREKLEAAGYKFEHPSAFAYFIKNRCRLEMDQHKHVRMYVDGKLFTTWWETIDVKMDLSNPNKVTATMICGLPPKEI